MKALVLLCGTLAAALTTALVSTGLAGGSNGSFTQYYPDLRTVVPTHLNLVNPQQRDILRFSNGIANVGPGPWALRAEHDLASSDQTTTAFQEIRTSNVKYRCGTQPKQVTECYDVVHEQQASVFEYHASHHHWHTADAALFEVRKGGPAGEIVLGNNFKVGFCLIEVYRLEGNSKTSERAFWDCAGTHQGAGAGWVDQYHQATDGQQVDLTGVPDGNYYLVSTVDPTDAFLEQNDDNNTAWVEFALTTSSKGNRKVTLTRNHSACESPGLCGVGAPNRG